MTDAPDLEPLLRLPMREAILMFLDDRLSLKDFLGLLVDLRYRPKDISWDSVFNILSSASLSDGGNEAKGLLLAARLTGGFDHA